MVTSHAKWARTVAVAVLTVLMAACGSGEGDAELTVGVVGEATSDEPPATLPPTAGPVAGTAKSACQALTNEEVATALGNAVRPGTGEGKNCFWGTSVDKGTSVYLSTTKPASADECNVQKAALAKEATREDVKGVGSSAVWVYQKVAILLQGTLVGCWNDAVVAVMVTGERDQAALRASAVTLAQRAHSRL